MKDIVDYELPLGPLGVAARWLFVRRALDRIFDYRRAAITEIFGQHSKQPEQEQVERRGGCEQLAGIRR